MLEVKLVFDVVAVFAALFFGWIMYREGRMWLVAAAATAAVLLLLRDLQQIRRLRRLRQVALTGLITQGEVTGSRPSRFSRGHRADGRLPKEGYPIMPGLEVSYRFHDEQNREWTGRLITSRKNAPFYKKGDRHEVFYLEEDPSKNISSLVMRWYWRFGGPAMTDEAPEEDFPLEEDVIVEELL